MLLPLILTVAFWFLPLALSARAADLEEQARQIAAELRCPVCQNLSVADSPSELAQQMRAVILEQLREGRSPEEVKSYFVSKYGEWVLLAPKPSGFNIVIWVLPFVAAGGGIFLVAVVARRWTRRKDSSGPITAQPGLAGSLRAELEELEFDFHAGKISEADYHELRQKLEAQAASISRAADISASGGAAPGSPPSPAIEEKTEKKTPETAQVSYQRQLRSTDRKRARRLALGGVFLLIFGITLGVLLTQSLRPRLSNQDSITGDFLTGTGSARDLPALLGQGRAAFERQEWPKAIQAFKEVLAIDANHPEAHSYMGLILAQAGHADAALMAFDRALQSDPKFPLALWGKGMLLYRAKEDFVGARETLEKLAQLMPPGEERNEVQKAINEIAQAAGGQKESPKRTQPAGGAREIKGTISLDPKLKGKAASQSVLFIVARSADSAAGPPLAVKKIAHPVFPLSYSLGPQDVMMPGAPFSGKVIISARLDRDGNPTTREAGDLIGEYKKNPVETGSEKVDIVIDRVM